MIHALATSVVLALASVSAPPAAPTPEYLLVSDDGVNYSTVSTFRLFADAGRVVPGDTITDQVWVKNSSSQAGRLRIDLTNARADDASFAAAVSIAVDPGDGSVTLADALANGNCTVVSSDLVLQPGESVRVEGSVSVDADLGSREGQTGREGHLATIGFQLRGIMIDAAVPSSSLPDNVCATTPEAIATPDTPHLPATGASTDPLLLALSGGAVGLGALLAIAARRRGQREG